MDESQLHVIREVGLKGRDKLIKYFKKHKLANEDVLDTLKDTAKDEILNSDYPYKHKMDKREYEKELGQLHIELVKFQNHVKLAKEKHLFIFEGLDAAGKGGTIKRFTEHLNPRGARVVALSKPSNLERTQWYFQRYVEHLPSAGEMVFFDRSWYNRAGVERVMRFCSKEDYKLFYKEAPQFERMLITSDINIKKFWFTVGRTEQMRRFFDRITDPLKQWKFSPMDIAGLNRWPEYRKAKEDMFHYTDHDDAPWLVIKSDCKKRARLNAIRAVLLENEYEGKNEDVIKPLDEAVICRAKDREL